MLVLACEFDNGTPYRVETIDKKRPRRGLMNRGEADDSVAPIGEVVRWIEGQLMDELRLELCSCTPPLD